MTESFKDTVLIFCDGACSGNPGPGGWAAIIADAQGNIKEMGGGGQSTTNNRMELTAAIKGLHSISQVDGKVIVCTDSVYVIRGITQWIFGWKKKNWKNAEGGEIANQDLWEELLQKVVARGKSSELKWRFVKGHSGVPGNERCDEIAVKYSKGEYVDLYRGPLIKYPVAIFDLPDEMALPEMKPKGEPKKEAYSYLSLLGGIALRHSTWPECERRVKGQSGAKFKKSFSEQEENEILKAWGVKLKN